MIKQWWIALEPREKNLILIAATLTVMIGSWFGVIAPLTQAKADARLELVQAVNDKALIDRALGTLTATSSTSAGPALNADTFRSEVTRAAQARGLAISRLQGGSDGTLQLVLNDVSPIEVYVWLQKISTQPGGETVRATISGREDKVQAVIELQGTMP